MKELIIIGAGGHGKVVADIAQKMGKYNKISFLDDADLQECMNLPVVGKTKDFKNFIDTCDIFVAIGDTKKREEWIEILEQSGANIPTLIHPSVIVGACVEIGKGSVVVAGAIINPCATIGKGVIINTGAIVDHDCKIGDYAHVSVGVCVAGNVGIGARTWIGIGATVKNGVSICKDCMIGAGAVVVNDIEIAGTYIGIPARKK